MFDVLTFGTATKDVFIKPADFYSDEKSLCFPLGSKIGIEEIKFSSGGGGTNTAVTFAKQGFSVAYCGKIGEDHSAEMIIRELKHYNVDCSMILTTPDLSTNHSVIISIPEKDRTILVYRGASELYSEKDISLSALKTKWIYFAPCGEFFYPLLEQALKEGIDVMVNPGNSQIRDERFKDAIKGVKILLLNKEEGSLLTGESEVKKIALAASKISNGMVIITKGEEGVTVFSEGFFYEAAPLELSSEDRTGAGDSFGSGFLSAYMRTNSIEEGIALGIANSTSCLKKIGAKKGLLNKEDNFKKVYVEKSSK